MTPNYPDFAAEAKQLANQEKENIQTRPLVLSDNAMFSALCLMNIFVKL